MSDFIPQSVAELTPEWLTGVLRGDLGERAVVDVGSEVLGEGEGFVGVLARLQLGLSGEAPGAPESVIAKFPTPVDENRAMGEMLGAYERELMFYREFAPDFPVRIPRVYYAEFDRDAASEKQEPILRAMDRLPFWVFRFTTPLARRIARNKRRRYLLVMEDLRRMRVGDQVAGATPDDLSRVLRSAARTHAHFWQSPRLQGQFWLLPQDLSCRMRHSMFRASRPVFEQRFARLAAHGLLDVTAWLETHGVELAQRLHREAPETLLHGDLRYDNVFFDDRDNDVVLIDFQLTGRGAGAYDIAYLMSSALDVEATPAVENALLHEYHDGLERGGVKDYPFDRFLRDYRRGLLAVLLTLTATDTVEMGEGDDRGVVLMERWIERLFARVRELPLGEILA